MDSLATPHDRFFRESFAHKEIARDFLRHHLPPEILAEIDLDSLSIAKDSYVSKELRKAYSDLVYRVRMRDGELQIYLLFEHKSRPEHWTLLQLLRYVVAAGDEYRKGPFSNKVNILVSMPSGRKRKLEGLVTLFLTDANGFYGDYMPFLK